MLHWRDATSSDELRALCGHVESQASAQPDGMAMLLLVTPGSPSLDAAGRKVLGQARDLVDRVRWVAVAPDGPGLSTGSALMRLEVFAQLTPTPFAWTYAAGVEEAAGWLARRASLGCGGGSLQALARELLVVPAQRAA